MPVTDGLTIAGLTIASTFSILLTSHGCVTYFTRTAMILTIASRLDLSLNSKSMLCKPHLELQGGVCTTWIFFLSYSWSPLVNLYFIHKGGSSSAATTLVGEVEVDIDEQNFFKYKIISTTSYN